MGFFDWLTKKNEPVVKMTVEETKQIEIDLTFEEMMKRFSQLFLTHHDEFNDNSIVSGSWRVSMFAHSEQSTIIVRQHDLPNIEIKYIPNTKEFSFEKGNLKHKSNSDCFKFVEKFINDLNTKSVLKTQKVQFIECGIIDMQNDYFGECRYENKFKISDCKKLIVQYSGNLHEINIFELKYNEKFEFEYVETSCSAWCIPQKALDKIKGKTWTPIETNSIQEYWVEESLNSDVVTRYNREQKMIEHVKDVIEKHEKYVNTSTKHGLIVPIPIRNFDSYKSFCSTLNIPTPYQNWEIENYLRSVGKYCPNK